MEDKLDQHDHCTPSGEERGWEQVPAVLVDKDAQRLVRHRCLPTNTTASHLSIRCILGDIRLWVRDPSTSSCRVSLPRSVSANQLTMSLVD